MADAPNKPRRAPSLRRVAGWTPPRLLRRHLESVCGPSRVAKGLAVRVAWYCVHHDTVKKLWVTLCICIAFRLPVRTWEHATAATRAALRCP
jgi:hypothetical protein